MNKNKKLDDWKVKFIFKLRLESGLGLFNARKCLEYYNWNYNKAKENWRKFFNNILYKS